MRKLFEEPCLFAECQKLYQVLHSVRQASNVFEHAEIKQDFLKEWQGFLEEYSRTEDFLILIVKLDELKKECDEGLFKCRKFNMEQKEEYGSISALFSELGDRARLNVYYFLKEHGYQNRVEVIKANNQLPRTEDGLKEKAEELNQRSNLLHEEIKARLSEYYDDEKKELNARYEEQLKILDEVAAIQQEYSTQELEIVWMQAHLAQPSLTDIHRPLSVISEEGEGVTSDDSPTSSRVGVCVGGSLEGAVETEISTSPLAMAGAGFKR